MFTKTLRNRITPLNGRRTFTAVTNEVKTHLEALGISNPNVVYNPR